MEYEFYLQDPTSPSTVYLFEAIIAAVRDADECRGMFAFASRGGVDSLLSDPEVVAFLGRGSLSLLVGMDAITNRGTLERLHELQTDHQRLSERVFWNRTAGLFHPKIAHFRYPNGNKAVIVGSGNLTPGGLRQNFEAFSIIKLGPRERLNLSGWDQFLQVHAGDIRAIDDEALERAARNIIRGRRRRVSAETEPDLGTPEVIVEGAERAEQAASEEITPIASAGIDRVLVATVPKAGGRWHQVHFNQDVVERYFRVQPNSTQRVYLTEVRQNGSFGEQEVRPCVLSQHNRNHKIEIGSHKGAAYPTNGKPILVFRELQARSFAYMLLMPGERGYRQLQQLMESLPSVGRGDPRVITELSELTCRWPDCPLLTQVQVAAANG